MSNDEEKEEEEVRREHTHLEEERVSLSVRVVFFLCIRAFRCTRRAILDFFGARDRRVLERRRAEFRAFFLVCIVSFWGGFSC